MDEDQQLRGGLRIAKGAVVGGKRDAEMLRQSGEAVGREAGEISPHRDDGAESGTAKILAEASEFLPKKSEVECRVVRDEYRLPHEPAEGPGDFRKLRGVGHHRIGDPGEAGDVAGNGPFGIHEGAELFDHLTSAHLHRADLGNPMLGGRPAGGFDVDHDVFLIRIGKPFDADDLHWKSGFFQRLQLDKLVSPDLIALRLDFDEAEFLPNTTMSS